MNDERGGKDVDLVEELEISSRPSSEYLNEKDDSIGEFGAYTCSDDNFYDIFDNEEEIITEYSIFLQNCYHLHSELILYFKIVFNLQTT